MMKAKKTVSRPGKDAEEGVTPAFLASLAAKIAPGMCLNAPRQAIEAAARLIECAGEWLAMPNAVGDYAIVLGEDRTVSLDSGALEDQFGPYAVHLYKIADK